MYCMFHGKLRACRTVYYRQTNVSSSYLQPFESRKTLEDTPRQGGEGVVTQEALFCFFRAEETRRAEQRP